MRLSIGLCFSILLISGCATTDAGKVVIDAGPKPTLEQATDAVMEHLRVSLKDPDSVKQFNIKSGPLPFSWYRGLIHGGGRDEAWLICFEYNAKNSYGGYVGVKTEGLALRTYGHVASVVPNVNWVHADRRC